MLAIATSIALGFVHGGETYPTEKLNAPVFIGLARLDDSALRDAVKSYYTFEFQRDWQNTYTYRSNTFRSTISYDTYSRRMQEDSSGWSLDQVNILGYISEYDVNIEDEIFIIEIAFIDEIVDAAAIVERNRAGTFHNGKRYTTVEQTIWAFRPNGWKCLDCGKRLHMTFNARFTMK